MKWAMLILFVVIAMTSTGCETHSNWQYVMGPAVHDTTVFRDTVSIHPPVKQPHRKK